MKTFQSTVTAGMTAMVFATLLAGVASAKCNVARPSQFRAHNPALQSLSMKQPSVPARRMDAAAAPEPSIAGYWYVRFFAGDQLFDDGFDVWNSDGTEILNDTTAPSSGAVCIGVWTKTGTLTYALKHPTWIFDDAGVSLIAITIIREQIQLDPGGNSFTGTLTADTYDLTGNPLDHETAQLTGSRITALDDTASYPSPIPGLPASIVNR